MIKENQPITATSNSMRLLAPGIWFFKGRFLAKNAEPDNTYTWFVYNKYVNNQLRDLLFFVKDIRSLRDMYRVLDEPIDMKVIPELIPGNFK